jgi:hypothetical protein
MNSGLEFESHPRLQPSALLRQPSIVFLVAPKTALKLYYGAAKCDAFWALVG